MREAQKPTELTSQEILGGMATGYLCTLTTSLTFSLGWNNSAKSHDIVNKWAKPSEKGAQSFYCLVSC